MYQTDKWFPKPRQPKSWVTLPTELKVMIVKLMDLETSSVFRKCGPDESFLVQKYKKFNVNICVKYCARRRQLCVVLEDLESKEIHFTWIITDLFSKRELPDSKIEFFKSFSDTFDVKVSTGKSIGAAASTILRSLLIDPLFAVKNLEFQLNSFNGTFYFWKILENHRFSELESLKLTNCDEVYPLRDLLTSLKLKSEKIEVTGPGKEWNRYVLLSLMYQEVTNKWSDISEVWKGFFMSFTVCHVGSFQRASKHTCLFVKSIALFRNLQSFSWALEKIHSRTTVNVLTYFRAAYSHPNRNVRTYFKKIDPNYDENILYLKNGIDNGSLNDHQLSVLSIVYIVRLLRNDPVIMSITDTIHDCFRLILDEYSEYNYFEKLMTKVEMLLPETPVEVQFYSDAGRVNSR